MVRRALVLLVALSAGACRPPPAQVLIIVDAQPAVRSATAGLSVNIWGGDRETELPEVVVHAITDPSSQAQWPRRFAVTPENGDPTRLYRFEAIARRTPEEQGEVVATARVISGYQAGETLQVYLLLYDACIDVDCTNPRETCDPATRRCRDAMQDPDDLMPFVPEAGLPDGGVAPVACEADADCADEHACTDDRCLDGRCSRTYVDSVCEDGVACTVGLCSDSGCMHDPDDSRCDDGVECTDDSCDGTGCVHMPNDALCTDGTGGDCDAANDCQYDTCDSTSCMADAPCETATCVGTVCMRTRCGVGQCCDTGSSSCEAIDDGNECTDDSCVPGTGAVHAPRSGLCEDGTGCTVGDSCAAGVCASGPRCDQDINPCRAEMCTAAGDCVTPPVTNGTPCGGSGSCNRCMDGVCQALSCGMDAGPPPDAGRDAGRDSGLDAGRDAGDAGRDADSGDTGASCPSGACLGAGETCCGMICCDLTSTTCCTHECCDAGEVCGTGGFCEPLDAGGDPGDACRSFCADMCCPTSSGGYACCSPGETCGPMPDGGCVAAGICDGGPCTMMM